MSTHVNNFPKLHNAAWPGVVGKGPDAEPPIDLDTMLDLTAAAEVDGVKFDGFDLFLFLPHINIDASDDELRGVGRQSLLARLGDRHGGGARLAAHGRRLGDGRRGGTAEVPDASPERLPDRQGVAGTGRAAARRGAHLDSACGVSDWSANPLESTKRIADTFRKACDIAEDHGERLAAEGEICWGGMHSLKSMVQLLEMVGRPQTLGFQADMAHTLLYLLGYNAPEDALLPAEFRLAG